MVGRGSDGEPVISGAKKVSGAVFSGNGFMPKSKAADTTFSLAQTETPAFKAWFGDSKVVDAEGKPLVVYHGTPEANFSSFNEGAHFTESPDYAAVYMNPSASSINTKAKRADAAAVFPVYLSIKQPFDTRNPKIKKVFEREFLNKRGNGTALSDRGLPDWTDSRDLLEWIEETGQAFDGLILDEGGTPEGGGRGFSYVPVKPTQIKSATGNRGTFDGANPDITFSLAPGALMAVHNTSGRAIRLMNQLGGMAAPSIAVIKPGTSRFTSFGDITLIVPPSVIDPTFSKKNKVFNADVYSPRFPRTRSKVSMPALRAAWKSLDSASEKLGNVLSSTLDANEIEREGLSAFENAPVVQLAFLEQSGMNTDIIQRTKVVVPAEWLALVSESDNRWTLSENPEFEKAVSAFFKDAMKNDVEAFNEMLLDGKIGRRELEKQATRAFEAKNPTIDRYRTDAAISDAIGKADLWATFRDWVSKEFSNVITSKQVQSYSERTEQTKWLAYDLATVARVMSRELRDGEGFNYGVGSIRSTVAKQFSSLAAMRKAGDSIVTEKAMEIAKKEASEEFDSLATELKDYYKYDASAFGYYDQASKSFKELGQFGMRKWEENYKDTPAELLGRVSQFLTKLANMPTEYFEAKVQRGVQFSELAGAVVPSGTDADVLAILDKAGVQVVEYPSGDKEARAAAVSTFTGQTFSLARHATLESKHNAGTITPEETAEAQKMVDEVAKKAGYGPRVAYHGTRREFTAFDSSARTQNDQGRFGKGFYFTGSKEIAEVYAGVDPWSKGEDRYKLPTESSIIAAYLSLENPKIIDASTFDSLPETAEEARAITQRAIDEGHDGIIGTVANKIDSPNTEIVVFSPSQIKSADPFTGVPLSERFDASTPDITMALVGVKRANEIEQVMRERRVSQRISTGEHEGKAFDPRLQERMKDNMYQVQSLPETVAEAMALIGSKDVTEVTRMALSETPSVPRAVQVALSAALLEHYNATGDMDSAFEVGERLSELGTELGRAVNSFKLLGKVLDTPAKAAAFLARQIKRVEVAFRDRQPAIDAAKHTVGDVQKEALKLLAVWIDEINGFKRANQVGLRVEDLPDVTFALSAEVRASGLVTVVAKMLQTGGAKQTLELLEGKYGKDKSEKLAEVMVAAQGQIMQGLQRKARKAAKKKKEGADKGETDKEAPETVAEGLSGVPELVDKATDEVVKRLKIRNLETPESVRDVVKSLFEKHGLAVTPAVIDRAFKEKFKIPKLSAEKMARLGELAKNIASTPDNSAERTDATMELTDFIREALGDIDAMDLAWSVWYPSILSGPKTHKKNMYANLWSLTTEIPLAAVSGNPRETLAKLRMIFSGGSRGLELGLGEFIYQVKTGKTSILKSGENKFRNSGLLERNPFKGKIGWAYNQMKYVGRFLQGEDLFAFAPAQEIKARMVAWEMANAKGLKGEALADEIEMILNLTDTQQADFGERAAGEWSRLVPELQAGRTEEAWVKRRVQELTMNERDGQLLERSSSFASRAVFNYTPDGVVGVLSKSAMETMSAAMATKVNDKGDILNKAMATSAKLIIPFVRIGANVLNRGIDYSGAGLPLSLLSKKLTGSAKQGFFKSEAKTVDEIQMERARGSLGLAVMGLVYLLSDPDDPDALFQIHGGGSGVWAKNTSLHGPAFKPYSIEIKSADGSRRFISLLYSPFAIGLGIIGNIKDQQRYKKFADDELFERTAAALLGGGAILLEQSFLVNLADFLKLWSGDGRVTEAALVSFIARTFSPVTAVPFSNLLRQVDSSFDDNKRDRSSIVAGLMANVPFAQRFGMPSVDILGDEITNGIFDWLTKSEAGGTPESRIYRAFGSKMATPSSLNTWRGKMEPDMFYAFKVARGQILKDSLLGNDMDYLREIEAATPEEAKAIMSDLSAWATQQAADKVGYVKPLPR